MKIILTAVFCLALALAQTRKAASGPDAATRFLEANYRAVDALVGSIAPERSLSKEQPVIVATVVQVDNLNGSRFGRVLAEQIGTRMSGIGYAVAELKLRGKIFVKQGEGELMLSREAKEISGGQSAQAVLVGTYAESSGGVYDGSSGYVFVTLKLVGVLDNLVIAAHDYVLPLDSTVRSLLYAPRN